MKKIYLLLSVMVVSFASMAQTIPNAGFENWRSGHSGASIPVTVTAPISWYGADSLIIAAGQTYGPFLSIPDTVWKQQVFKDSTDKHSGSYSAKLLTLKEDTLGIFPGVLSNAKANLDIDLTGGTFNVFYTGGTPLTYRVKTVSAWVKYVPGAAGDSGVLTVQAMGRYGSIADSVLGFGSARVGATSGFVQITANVLYAIPDSLVDTVRITFTSSRGGTGSKVNSVMYVDDVSMTGTPFSVAELAASGKVVSLYPNPATSELQIQASKNEQLTCHLISVTGAVVATKNFNGSATMDLSGIVAGMYYYNITDSNNNVVQTGSVSVSR